MYVCVCSQLGSVPFADDSPSPLSPTLQNLCITLTSQMAEVHGIRDFLQELSATGGDMGHTAVNVFFRAAAAIEDIATARCRALIDIAGHRPLLQAFMSDGWSSDVRTRHIESSGDTSVHSRGGLRT